ncbi:MAG: hypothetical protein AB7F86_13905 [Bdellovibrionales bacterium]
MVLISLLLNLAWASSPEHESPTELAEYSARSSSRDIPIPRALVARIESQYDAFLTAAGVLNKKPYKRSMLVVGGDLISDHHGTLTENVRLATPLGGGVVDLEDLVKSARGVFTARFEAHREHQEPPADLHVYFVSHTKRRQIDGERFGAGCNTWMDLTGYYHKVLSKSGIQLYTAEQRYLSVLGGTFVLVHFSTESIGVGSLTFTDSRFPQVICQ